MIGLLGPLVGTTESIARPLNQGTCNLHPGQQALVFVVLEIAEVPHQHNEVRTGLVVLDVIAGITHLIAAGLAGIKTRDDSIRSRVSAGRS